jgi:hypothetical protein
MRSYSFRLLPLLFILVGSLAQARTFKNAYISFEMLDTWKCNLEQTEWVCRSQDPQESKEAVIILTAKEKGPTDTFPIYIDHLSKPMTLNLRTGGTAQSIVNMPPREEIINDQKWLDSLHTGSEVQNYFTRYLATIKDQIAILITFSAHNKYYAKHRSHFMDTVRSLRVTATKDLLSRPDVGPLRGSGEVLGAGIGQAMPGDLLAADDEAANGDGEQKKGLLQNEMVLGGGILLLVALAYIAIKMKKG